MYFLVKDFGTKVEVDDYDKIPEAFDLESWDDLIEANGGVMPDIVELEEDDYLFDDGYDVI